MNPPSIRETDVSRVEESRRVGERWDQASSDRRLKIALQRLQVLNKVSFFRVCECQLQELVVVLDDGR
jgi:hypothetical protein